MDERADWRTRLLCPTLTASQRSSQPHDTQWPFSVFTLTVPWGTGRSLPMPLATLPLVPGPLLCRPLLGLSLRWCPGGPLFSHTNPRGDVHPCGSCGWPAGLGLSPHPSCIQMSADHLSLNPPTHLVLHLLMYLINMSQCLLAGAAGTPWGEGQAIPYLSSKWSWLSSASSALELPPPPMKGPSTPGMNPTNHCKPWQFSSLSLELATFLHPHFCRVRLLPALTWRWWPGPALFLSVTFCLFDMACSSQDLALSTSQPPPSHPPVRPQGGHTASSVPGSGDTLSHGVTSPWWALSPLHPCPVLIPLLMPACPSGPELRIALSTKSPTPQGWVGGILQFAPPQTPLTW